jgi:hypothetical protein
MLIEKTKKRAYSFNLDKADQRAEYEEVLNDPTVKIISKEFVNQSESDFGEDFSTTKTERYVYLEVEECSF